MKLWIHGYSGRMGQLIAELSSGMGWGRLGFSDASTPLTSAVSEADLVIDFTSATGSRALYDQMAAHRDQWWVPSQGDSCGFHRPRL